MGAPAGIGQGSYQGSYQGYKGIRQLRRSQACVHLDFPAPPLDVQLSERRLYVGSPPFVSQPHGLATQEGGSVKCTLLAT